MSTDDDREVVTFPADGQPLRQISAWDLLGVDPKAELRSGRASEIEAAEARGYRKAIERLRADEGRSAASALLRREMDDINGRKIAFAMADYLEAEASR